MAKNSKPGTPAGSKQPPVRPTGRPTGRPPVKKAGKSIVNQKQFPWGWVITAAVLVVFAAVIVVVAVSGSGKDKSGDPAYTADASDLVKGIQGVIHKVEPNHTHIQGNIEYDTTPPTGGNHSQYWADCTGTVYTQPIANENAVHALEHGAVWVTYNADKVKGADLDTLKKYVSGVEYTMMSPYPDLKTAVSLQFWGYQLFVDKVNDPRIQAFIDALRHSSATPEPSAGCSQPTFVTNPSTFGHPLWVPATGGSAPSMTGSGTPSAP